VATTNAPPRRIPSIAKDKWKDVAQLLALSDGFRGKITTSPHGPYATRAPFTVEYEITQPKFIDWSKKPVRHSGPSPAAWIA